MPGIGIGISPMFRRGNSLRAYWTTLTATGDGTGVATLRIKASSNIVATLDGANANFYTDAAGTLGESKTWNITAGALRTIYLKCTAATATLSYSNYPAITAWGDSSNEGYVSGANAPAVSGDIGGFINLVTINGINNNTLSGNIARLSKATFISIGGSNTITGDITNLNTAITTLSISSTSTTVYGSIAALVNLTNLALNGTGVITGDCTNLTKLVRFYIINDNNTISGDVSGMTDMEFMEIRGNAGATDHNTTTGDISGMTKMYNYWIVGDSNTQYGSLTNLVELDHFYNSSTASKFTGSINGLTKLVAFQLTGALHEITGDIHNLVATVTNFDAPSCRISDYTSPSTFLDFSTRLRINANTGYGLTTAEVDALLADLADSTSFIAPIEIAGANDPRSIGSDADVATLVTRGCTVTTNKYPVFVSAAVLDADPDVVVLTYNQALDETSVPDTDDFTVTGKTISAVEVVGATVKLTVTVPYTYATGATNVTYTLDTNLIQDAVYGLSCNSLGSTAITNNVLPILGAEMVDQSNWYINTWWDWNSLAFFTRSGSTLVCAGSAGNLSRGADKADFWVSGHIYQIKISYTWTSGTGNWRGFYDGSGTYTNMPKSNQTDYTYNYTASTGNLYSTVSAGAYFTLTALSIKEITG